MSISLLGNDIQLMHKSISLVFIHAATAVNMCDVTLCCLYVNVMMDKNNYLLLYCLC
jgi:hypothetical protein